MTISTISSAACPSETCRDAEGHWYQLRLRPYKTFENQVDGAVIMLTDIDTLKKNQDDLARLAELLEHGRPQGTMCERAGARG